MGKNKRNVIFSHNEEEAAKVPKAENTPEKGESLVVNKFLLKETKEVVERAQRKNLFRSV